MHRIIFILYIRNINQSKIIKMENSLQKGTEIIYNGFFATIKDFSGFTVLISTPLFNDPVWVPIKQIEKI